MVGKSKKSYRGYKDLRVYQMAYQLVLDIHEVTKTFPKEERYSLVDQIRRSSRSVPANLAEAWNKRRYRKMFVSKVIDAAGEGGETEVWLDFSLDFKYLNKATWEDLVSRYDEVNRMLSGMIDKADRFSN
jgi:four helix bundle protein